MSKFEGKLILLMILAVGLVPVFSSANGNVSKSGLVGTAYAALGGSCDPNCNNPQIQQQTGCTPCNFFCQGNLRYHDTPDGGAILESVCAANERCAGGPPWDPGGCFLTGPPPSQCPADATPCFRNNGLNCTDLNKANIECADYWQDGSYCSTNLTGPHGDGCIPTIAPSQCPADATNCFRNNGLNCTDLSKASSECADYYQDNSYCDPSNKGIRGDGCINPNGNSLPPPSPPQQSQCGFGATLCALNQGQGCTNQQAANNACSAFYRGQSTCDFYDASPDNHNYDGCTLVAGGPSCKTYQRQCLAADGVSVYMQQCVTDESMSNYACAPGPDPNILCWDENEQPTSVCNPPTVTPPVVVPPGTPPTGGTQCSINKTPGANADSDQPTGTITKTQADCIIQKKAGAHDLVKFYRDNAWCVDNDDQRIAMVNNWVNVVPGNGAEDQQIKAQCGVSQTSTQTCTLTANNVNTQITVNSQQDVVFRITSPGLAGTSGTWEGNGGTVGGPVPGYPEQPDPTKWTSQPYKLPVISNGPYTRKAVLRAAANEQTCTTNTVSITVNPAASTVPSAGPTGPGRITPGGSRPPSAPPSGGSRPPSVPPSTTPGAGTVSYKIAETRAGLATAVAKPYTEPLVDNLTFTDTTPGAKAVWVEFISTDPTKHGGCGPNQTEPCLANVELLGPEPAITGCSLDTDQATNVTTFNIIGRNFGVDPGTVVSGSGSLGVGTGKWTGTKVAATLSNAPIGESFPITLTRHSDSQKTDGVCSSISQIAFSGRLFCPQVDKQKDFKTDLSVVEALPGGTVKKGKLTLKGGVISDTQAKLQEGVAYIARIKVEKGLAKLFNFTASKGTTNIPNLILPLGDICPQPTGDGGINSIDYACLKQQWGPLTANKSCDLNGDQTCNTFDWACMKESFNDKDAPELSASLATQSTDTATNNAVQISNFSFSPATLTVKMGDSVTWSNADSVGHSATADDQSFDTGVLDPGKSASVTFNKKGTFTYHCSVHPNMKGIIIVQ